MSRAERISYQSPERIRLAGAGEHKWKFMKLKIVQGLILESSPPCAPQSKGRAEVFVKELYLRAGVMLTNNALLDQLWAEAMHQGNWLCNKLPTKMIEKITNLPLACNCKLHRLFYISHIWAARVCLHLYTP